LRYVDAFERYENKAGEVFQGPDGTMILVTGAAGFIGFHVTQRLLQRGEAIVGLDNLNPYYDVRLKEARLEQLQRSKEFQFERLDLADRAAIASLFERYPIRRVVHLAAQAGVRYSLTNPHAYVDSNLTGFINILEGCRHIHVEHLVYASSSSVYGGNTHMPFSVHDNVDHPVSLYAATKKANELMAHCYAHLYRTPCSGLRFFTVYGPWGRPDMALFIFTKAILEGKPIEVFNFGKMQRDFTYIEDIAEGVIRVLDKPAVADGTFNSDRPAPNRSSAPYRIYNIGNHQPVELLHLIEVLEKCIGKKAEKVMLPIQPGDVPGTYADVDDLVRDIGFRPTTPIDVGVMRFVQWYREFYTV
jgi:UDP-glucuronate 4-epimerase